MHDALRSAVMRLSAKDLAGRRQERKSATLRVLSGVAAHDLYHAGQIQILKRLSPM